MTCKWATCPTQPAQRRSPNQTIEPAVRAYISLTRPPPPGFGHFTSRLRPSLKTRRGGEKRLGIRWLLRKPWDRYRSTGGVVVKPGETLKCDPGGLYCVVSQIALEAGKGNENVEVFVKVDGNILLMATLSVFRHPQDATELIFEEEFELLHTSKTSNVFFMGHKFREGERKYLFVLTKMSKPLSGSDRGRVEYKRKVEGISSMFAKNLGYVHDESKEAKIGSEKLAAPRRPTVQSSKPKVTLEKTKNPGKLNVVGRSDDDENAKGQNRPAETPLKRPLEKKAKIRTSFPGKNTASGSTGKERGHVHVATPYPSSKQVKRSPFSISPGHVCKSCSKSFYSPVALEIHCKLKKHGAHK